MNSTLVISESLKLDLQDAYEYNTNFHSKTQGLWINAIDPENMNKLKDLLKKVNGSYSLSSLAYSIIRNKKIKL